MKAFVVVTTVLCAFDVICGLYCLNKGLPGTATSRFWGLIGSFTIALLGVLVLGANL